jgi:hypothetical protein
MNIVGRREYDDEQTDRASVHLKVRARALKFGCWKPPIEKLKEKWTKLAKEIIRAIAEEEMEASREEFDKQIGTGAR